MRTTPQHLSRGNISQSSISFLSKVRRNLDNKQKKEEEKGKFGTTKDDLLMMEHRHGNGWAPETFKKVLTLHMQVMHG